MWKTTKDVFLTKRKESRAGDINKLPTNTNITLTDIQPSIVICSCANRVTAVQNDYNQIKFHGESKLRANDRKMKVPKMKRNSI